MSFRCKQFVQGGTGAFSASGIFTTTSSSSACAIPSGLIVVSAGANTASIDWASASGATSYNVRYKKTNSSSWIVEPSSNSSETLTGLSSGSEYEFQVQTICSAGTGSYSGSAIFMTTTGTSACGIPEGLTVSGITTSAASLEWDAVSSATSYNIRYKQTNSSTWINATSSNLTEGITLSPGSAYEFQVQSVCAAGASTWSASSVFSTLSNGGTSALPVPDHVVIVVFENHSYSRS
ncbi:MAG: fibronectin type III domain-containing protein [Bacteroidetes bacterium]|nr:fibronectin type III domain-containing protein [Bacteroidota bacterium]